MILSETDHSHGKIEEAFGKIPCQSGRTAIEFQLATLGAAFTYLEFLH